MLGDQTTGRQSVCANPRDLEVLPEGVEPKGRAPGEPVFASSELFRDHKQISIEHNGERYVLRITRLGKLVLNK